MGLERRATRRLRRRTGATARVVRRRRGFLDLRRRLAIVDFLLRCGLTAPSVTSRAGFFLAVRRFAGRRRLRAARCRFVPKNLTCLAVSFRRGFLRLLALVDALRRRCGFARRLTMLSVAIGFLCLPSLVRFVSDSVQGRTRLQWSADAGRTGGPMPPRPRTPSWSLWPR